jgi:hypothetical protein
MPVKKQQECAPKTVWQMLLFRHDRGGLLQLLNNNINQKNTKLKSALQRMKQINPFVAIMICLTSCHMLKKSM